METGNFARTFVAYRVGVRDLKLSPELTNAILDAADECDLDFFQHKESEA